MTMNRGHGEYRSSTPGSSASTGPIQPFSSASKNASTHSRAFVLRSASSRRYAKGTSPSA
jgi:hypothetical protein